MEDSGYSSAAELAEGLEVKLTVAYADPATATAFTEEAEALGSTTVDSMTVVVFEDPVVDYSSITEEVVRTSAPTATPGNSGDDYSVILIAVLVSVVVLIIIAAVGFVAYNKSKNSSVCMGEMAHAGATEMTKSSATGDGSTAYSHVTTAGEHQEVNL